MNTTFWIVLGLFFIISATASFIFYRHRIDYTVTSTDSILVRSLAQDDTV